jgi:hypothetical protein
VGPVDRLFESPPTSHAWTPRKVVFVSGLSDPATCALTAEQHAFLRALPIEEEAKVGWNFPFVACDRPRGSPPLWLAGWRNYRQFRDASGEAYRRLGEPHWRSLRDSTAQLCVITLSCGLEIVNRFLDPIRDTEKVRVIALGPVARRRPAVPHTLVQGQADWISRRFFPAADVTISAVGHMDYVTCPDVLTCVRDRLWTNAST